VEYGHYPKVAQDIFEGLSFHQSHNIITTHQGIISNGKRATLCMCLGELPWITLIARNTDSDVMAGGASYEFGRWSVLLNRPLSEPEDLLIAFSGVTLIWLKK
jgi:hypothetical protein